MRAALGGDGFGTLGAAGAAADAAGARGGGARGDDGDDAAAALDAAATTARVGVPVAPAPEVTVRFSDAARLAYVVMPKGGSKQIGDRARRAWNAREATLTALLGGGDGGRRGRRGRRRRGRRRVPAAAGALRRRDYLVFTFVRDPVDHFLSGLHRRRRSSSRRERVRRLPGTPPRPRPRRSSARDASRGSQ